MVHNLFAQEKDQIEIALLGKGASGGKVYSSVYWLSPSGTNSLEGVVGHFSTILISDI